MADGEDCRNDCVSWAVSVVRVFQAQFQMTLVQRVGWMLVWMVCGVWPCARRLVKVVRRVDSMLSGRFGFGYSPSSVSSDVVCWTRPGVGWEAPTQVCEEKQA